MRRLFLLGLGLAAALSAQTIETIPYRVNLSSLNEVPAISGDPSTATATVLLHVLRDATGQIVSGSVDFRVNYKLASANNVTLMHIHRGAAGVSGPVVIDSGLPAPVNDTTTGTLRLQGQVQPSNANALAALRDIVTNPSGFYLNMHTTRNPAGELRGQLMKADHLVLMGLMNTDNEVPPVPGVTATAVCSVQVVAARADSGVPLSAEVIFDANYVGFPDGTNFTGFHIHSGPAGVNAPVVINTGLTGQVPAVATGGNLHYEVQIDPANPVQSASVAGLFYAPSQFYVNIHTTTSPAGVIRAQLRTTDRASFQTTLMPANEIPAVSIDASAPAAYTQYTLRNNEGWVVAGLSVFDVNFRFPGAVQFTGMHIHDGGSTVNGPVVINSGLAQANQPNSDTGFGNLFRTATQSTPAAVNAMNLVASNPNASYFNIHTTVNPGGVARAQTAPPLATPVVTDAISGNSDPTNHNAAPLGLMTIFGSSLFGSPSSSSAYESAAPLQLNGTIVMVGTKQAAIVTMGREPSFTPTDYIVAQIPADSSFGPQAVTVNTGAGSSRPVNINVAAVAPALYFDKTGGVTFHVSDMTLISASNPAVSGEPIAILATNLGRTLPPLNTGQIIGQDTLSLVLPNPAVTIGGKQAAVTGAGIVPGFVGFYLIIATVPDGVSGTVPLSVAQVTTGSTAPVQSNTVTLFVR